MKIIIPGIPVAQARMKHCNRKGFVNTYDPKAKEKNDIRWMLKQNKSYKHIDFPRVSFLFHMPIPKSIKKKEHEIYHSGRLKHYKKPDVDNLIKLYLDCLDDIVLEGDEKVSLGPCLKIYHPEPKTIIWISETTSLVNPWELDNGYLDEKELDVPSFCERDFPLDSYNLYRQVLSLSLQKFYPGDTIASLAPLVPVRNL